MKSTSKFYAKSPENPYPFIFSYSFIDYISSLPHKII